MENLHRERFFIALAAASATLLAQLPKQFRMPLVVVESALRYHCPVGQPASARANHCPASLILIVRGAPLVLYQNVLKPTERLPFALYSDTGLPLIIIIAEIGTSSGLLPTDHAAVLVGAGMISVLLFPILAHKCIEKAAQSDQTHAQDSGD